MEVAEGEGSVDDNASVPKEKKKKRKRDESIEEAKASLRGS